MLDRVGCIGNTADAAYCAIGGIGIAYQVI
jgi:hypothetical protein